MTKSLYLVAGIVMISLYAGTSVAADFHAVLSGSQEVPPVTTKGKGTATFVLNPVSGELSWKISVRDLSADAVAAHIHGPASYGANAGVIVNLAPDGMANPLTGKSTLTKAQVKELTDGLFYVNVHTSSHSGGEIRAQIIPGK